MKEVLLFHTNYLMIIVKRLVCGHVRGGSPSEM